MQWPGVSTSRLSSIAFVDGLVTHSSLVCAMIVQDQRRKYRMETKFLSVNAYYKRHFTIEVPEDWNGEIEDVELIDDIVKSEGFELVDWEIL
jgi:hypothetical protein